ncbi:MAG: PSD1 and planctomycete cytochrome C domain-containing protein, partial [Verrucomicrobiota bacterium]
MLFGWILTLSVSRADFPPDQVEFFENKVRPILANNCYKCHSVEQGTSKGGLTLDTRAGVLNGGESGPLLTPGDPEKSLIIHAIRYTDPDLKMPKKTKLTDDEIAALTEWVKRGAPDPRVQTNLKLSGLNDKARGHWAYQPIQKKSPPSIKNSAWRQSPIDRFIFSKLEEKGMEPSPMANKETLIRRAYYDLIGLPPSPQEIEAFQLDQDPDAFARVVDRLLASPHYGERWGRHWLDTARYSDTVGGNVVVQKIGKEYRYPYAWGYRDYVIDSFNRDKPYDQFIVEQLAADQLPEAEKNPGLLSALGFLTVGERFENVNDEINEQIDTVSKGFLGVTVSCARCHDHPFDPIPTADYYALHGVFASTQEPPEKPIVKSANAFLYLEFLQRRAALEKSNQEAFCKMVIELNSSFLKKAPLYLKWAAIQIRGKLTSEETTEKNELSKKGEMDGQLLNTIVYAMNQKPENDPTFSMFKKLARIPEADFAKKAGDIIHKKWEEPEGKRSLNPLIESELRRVEPKTRQDLITLYSKCFSQAAPFSEVYLKKVFESPLTDEVEGSSKRVKTLPTDVLPDPNLAPFLSIPLKMRKQEELTIVELRRVTRELPFSIRTLAEKIKPSIDLNAINLLELTDPGAPDRAMSVVDVLKPHDSPVFIRGQAQVKGSVVPRHFLSILSPDGKPKPFESGSGRLELARGIADAQNPLTARVLVNRVWMHHFGAGFVPTTDNLGTQSELPSHPELLDYLASYFMENGWSLKKLHRFIMLSRTYQESSSPHKDYEALDPENKFLWRSNVKRLDFESFRDSLLVFSGKLDETAGGKPVNLVEEPYSYRRTVYGYIDRGNLPELMAFFDFSNPDAPNSQRSSTIVPQQALFLMNSPMIIGVVRDILARSEIKESSGTEEKITALYRIILQRTPKPEEVELAKQFLTAEKELDLLPSSAKENTASSPANSKSEEKEKPKEMNMMAMAGVGPKGAIRNQGSRVQQKPLTS